MEEIIEYVGSYINAGNNKLFGRYQSWDLCYEAFKNAFNNSDNVNDVEKNSIIDSLSLHLTVFLASWGMYRGSSFLLQKCNYKVHYKIVEKYLIKNMKF